MEQHQEELAAIESLDSGAVYTLALKTHVGMSIQTFRWVQNGERPQLAVESVAEGKNAHRPKVQKLHVRILRGYLWCKAQRNRTISAFAPQQADFISWYKH